MMIPGGKLFCISSQYTVFTFKFLSMRDEVDAGLQASTLYYLHGKSAARVVLERS